MTNKNTQKVLKIFIASPGDVNPERRALKEEIDTINRIVRNIDWHIDLYGSEDTLPGIGRPQEIINRYVDCCNLFIGILWKRWGEPTGEFSSGFEEEFFRVKERSSEIEKPEVWIFFKKIDDESDAGPQLVRVLEFRKEQEASKQIFFHEFLDIEEYRTKVREYLLTYILGSHNSSEHFAEEASTQEAISPIKGEEPPAIHSTNNEGKSILPNQVTELIGVIALATKNNKFEIPPRSGEDSNQFDTARFYLIASTLLSQKYSSELLDAHCNNILFRYKEKLELTQMERNYIFRTIIGSASDNVAGWYWIDNIDTNMLRDMLFIQAMGDTNIYIRINSINILKLAKLRPKDEWLKGINIFALLLSDKLDSIKIATLSYLASMGEKEDLDLLEKYLEDSTSSVYNNTLSTKLAIAARYDTNNAFSQLLSLPKDRITKETLVGFEKLETNLSDSILFEAIHSDNYDIKLFGAKALARRGMLTGDLISDLLENSRRELAEICYKEVVRQDIKIDPEKIKKDLADSFAFGNEVLIDAYTHFTMQELEAKIEWYEVDGPIAYEVLANRDFEVRRESIRKDLCNQFEELYKAYMEKLKSKFGEEGIKITEILHKHDKFISLKYIAAGLSVLSEHGDLEDVQIARKYIDSDDIYVKTNAVKIIARSGDLSDIDSLLRLCKNSYGDLKVLSANVALKLSPGVDGVAVNLLNTNDDILIKLALKSVCINDTQKVSEIVEPLLKNENENIRVKALYYLITKFSREYLEDLLNRYVEQPIYYYNVVCWLDRAIYANEPIRDVLMKKLEQTFG